MNTFDISLYIKKISSQQEELISILHEGVSSILIPNDSDSDRRSLEQPSKTNNNQKFNGTMVVGGALAVTGLFIGSPIKWFVIGAGALAVANGYKQLSSYTQPSQQHTQMGNSVNYDELVSRVNRGLSSVNRNIVNSWDNFIMEQKNQLKNHILQLDIDVDKKDAMMNLATKTAVLDFTMSSLYAKLNAAAKSGSSVAFKSVCAQFETEYKNAINKVCSEQIQIWSEIK